MEKNMKGKTCYFDYLKCSKWVNLYFESLMQYVQ